MQIVASHPQFDPRTFEYDLALLRFYEPVTFQPNILPICVPHDDTNFVGHTAYVTGWGRLYEGKCHYKFNPSCTLCSQSDVISFCVITPVCTPFKLDICNYILNIPISCTLLNTCCFDTCTTFFWPIRCECCLFVPIYGVVHYKNS